MEDSLLLNQILNDYEISKSNMSKNIDRWIKYDDYMDDVQWEPEINSVDDWMPQPQVNMVYPTVRNIHATVTGGETSINITAKKDNKKMNKKSNDITMVMNYYWELMQMENKVSEGEWIRIVAGSVIYKTFWNPDSNNGKGDLCTKVLHPSNVFFDPNINNPFQIQDCEFIDIVYPMSIRAIIRKFSKENDKLCKYSIKELKNKIYFENDTEIIGDTSNNDLTHSTTGFDRNKTELHEYWHKHMDDDGKVTLQVAWKVNSILLKSSLDDKEIKENGFYEHGKYPIVLIPYIQVPKRLYGRSEVQALVGMDKKDGLQDIINKLLQDYLVNEKLLGQGQWAVRSGALADINQLTNEPGAVFEVPEPHRDLKKLVGVNQNDLLPVIDKMMDNVDKISGQYELLRGGNMSGVNTFGQTSLLLEQGQKPLNSKIETLNWGLSELVKLWIEMLSEFGNYREFNIDDEIISDLFENEQESKKEIGESIASPIDYCCEIDIGAKLAFSKSSLMNLGLDLYGRGLLDLKGIYDLLPNFPGKEETLNRLLATQGVQLNQNEELEPIGQPGQPVQPVQPEFDPKALEDFISILPQEIINQISQMSEQERMEYLIELMNSQEGQRMIEEAKMTLENKQPTEQEINDFVTTLPQSVIDQLNAIPDEEEKTNLILDMMTQSR